jgi:hypothetical protein
MPVATPRAPPKLTRDTSCSPTWAPERPAEFVTWLHFENVERMGWAARDDGVTMKRTVGD